MNSRRALVVEDDPELSLLFSGILADQQWETELEHDGKHVLARIQALQPDIVLLDLHLPHVTGLEILRALRADEAQQAVRVMAITASPKLAQQAQSLADLVLLKPVSYDRLVTMVEQLAAISRP